MAKKLNHHLYQDRTSGVWYFQKKVRGTGKSYKFSLETKSVVEARRKRDSYLKQIDIHGCIQKSNFEDVSESLVFGEVAQKWAKIVKPNAAETTYVNYKKVMNKHVLPRFGNVPIDSITGLDIEVFISKLKCKSKTKHNILTPLRRVMKFAKTHHMIQANPFDDVAEIKRTKGGKPKALNLDEVRRFMNCLNDFWKPLFLFLFLTGVRIAEAAGLKWKHVDLVNGIVRIRKTIVFVNGKAIYKEPKTESSIRDVKLPEVVIEALREQRKRTWKGNRENFVFLNREGRNIHRQTLNRGVIRPTLKKAGIATHISIKDTRASFITNSLDKNERLSFVQSQVGHTTTRMIVDHYYRHVPAPDDGARLEEAWNSTRILPDQDVAEKNIVELQ